MTTATVIAWLAQYRYIVLFPLVVIEGPIVTVLAGFLASLGQLNLFICYPLIVVGDILGDLIMYAQGRWGGKPAVSRWGHHFGIKPETIVRLENRFKDHPGKTLIFGKVSHFFGGPILIAAGMARMSISEFLWFNFLGTLPKSLILLLLGFYFGQAYVKFDKFFTYAGWAAAILVVIGIIIYVVISKTGKNISTKSDHVEVEPRGEARSQPIKSMDFLPQKKIVETDKGNICYFMAGPADATRTVMLLHGLSSNHTTWLALMEELAAKGIRSIAPDLRGHGFSDMSKKKEWYAFSVFADDIQRIALRERLQKFDMVGYSFGGYVALTYAIAYPESLRSLALVSTNFMNPLQYGPFSLFTPAAIAFCETTAWLTYPQRRKNYYYFEHGKSTSYFNSTFKGLLTMPLSINFWMLKETLRLDLSTALSRITCPTLLVRSTNDPYLTEKEVALMTRLMPHARAVTIAGDSHFLASRNQDLLAQELLPFLENPKAHV